VEMAGREEYFRKIFDRYFTGIEYTLFSCYFLPPKMWEEKEKAMFCVWNTAVSCD